MVSFEPQEGFLTNAGASRAPKEIKTYFKEEGIEAIVKEATEAA